MKSLQKNISLTTTEIPSLWMPYQNELVTDLGVHYKPHSSDDGANIMIDNGWMEKPPITVDRKELAK